MRFQIIRRLDPRLYQIATLSGLLLYGMTRLNFEVDAARAATLVAGALFVQYLCTILWKLPAYDPKSALISGLSLCLLLRTNDLLTAVLTVLLTISSKFVLRRRNKHFFNPTNFGLVFMMLLTDAVWVSPGQWGNVAFFGFLMACLGGLVVNRSSRSDITYSFMVFYFAILFGRAWWLGQPMTIPAHMLQSGAFLLFTFFMISDPKTTPDSRTGRILFSLLVALGAGTIHFVLYRPNGLLWSLALVSILTPVIDWILPGTKYEWNNPSTAKKGVRHETKINPRPAPVPVRIAVR